MHIGRTGPKSPVVLHFHGAPWLAEQSVAAVYSSATVAALQIGSGSSVYQNAFDTREEFDALLQEAEAGERPVILTAFSAGYGAVRAILRHSADRVDSIVLMDALHAGYGDNRTVKNEDLEPFLAFARRAMNRQKRLIYTHSEVYPGTFASTTETADWLLTQLQLRRTRVLKWGPQGVQQLSNVQNGHLWIGGFAGNSAPDHVDHLHGMAAWLRRLQKL